MMGSIKAFFDKYLASDEQQGHSEHQLQLATAALMLETARADHHIDSAELDVIQQEIEKAFNLTQQESHALMQLAQDESGHITSYYPITKKINDSHTQEEKIRIIELMWTVALCDNNLDKHEEHLVRKIANLIYVARDDIVAAKYRAAKALSIDL